MANSDLRRAWKRQQAKKQDVTNAIPALMGNGHGDVAVPNQPGMVYIRLGDDDLGQAYNNRCPLADNLAIYVGYDPILDPDRRIFQVLSVRMADYAAGGNTNVFVNSPPHHLTHEFGGSDDVYIAWRRLMGLRVGRPAAFVVTVDGGYIYRAGAWLLAPVGATTVDLTATHTALIGTQAQMVLVSLNAAGALATTNSAVKASPGALTIADCPTPPVGNIPLAAVRLYAAQTAIGDTPTNPDIIDLRFPTYGTMLSGPGVLGNGTAQYQVITTGANPYPPAWSDFFIRGTTGGTTNLAVTNTKTLTLTAADSYNLTAEISGAVLVRTATPNIVATPLAGNARGVNAVDLQLVRTAATQVASGLAATLVGGTDNTASNSNSTNVGGYTNVASGSNSTTVGGSSLTASGTNSVAIGGATNLASNGYSAVVGGDNNTASGDRAVVIAGATSTASGDYSSAFGPEISATHNGAKLFSDYPIEDTFSSITTQEFAVRAQNGFRLAYDNNNYYTAKVANNGVTTFATLPVGAGFVFTPSITLSSVTASTLIYADASRVVVSLANSGSASYLKNDGAGALSWVTTVPPSAHNILDSAYHGDVLTGAITAGDVLIGNATPKIARLAITVPAAGTLNYFGVNNGETLPSWKSASASITGASASILQTDTSGFLRVLRMGLGAAPNLDYGLNVTNASTDPGTNKYAILATTNVTATVANAVQHWGLYFTLNALGAGNFTNTLFGAQGFITHLGTGTLSAAHAMRPGFRLSAAGNALAAYVLSTTLGTGAAGSGALDDGYNIYIESPTMAGAGIIKDLYGLYIAPMTVGTLLNYAIYTNAGINRIGDQISIVGSADRQQFICTGFTTQAVATTVAQITRNDTAAGISSMLGLTALGSGANGDGGSILMAGKSSTTASQSMALAAWSWVDATHASRKAKYVLSVYDTLIREALTIEADGAAADVYFSGGAGSGLPHGSCWGNEIGQVQANAVQNQWYLISDADMADGQLNLVAHDGSGKLTVTKAGRYWVIWSITLEANAGNHHLAGGIAIGGTVQNDGQSHFESSANVEGVITSAALLSLAAAATVELAFRTTTAGTPTITIDDVNLVVVQIGG